MVKKKSFLIAVYRTSGIRARSSRRSSFYLQSSVYSLAGQRPVIQSTSAFHWGIIMSWPAIVGYYSRQPTQSFGHLVITRCTHTCTPTEVQNSSISSFPGNDLHKVTGTCKNNAKIVKGIRHPDEFQGEKNSEATHA